MDKRPRQGEQVVHRKARGGHQGDARKQQAAVGVHALRNIAQERQHLDRTA